MGRTPLIVILLAAALLALPSAALANAQQISIVQDDDLLLYRDGATRDRALQQMKQLGVDAVRATVLWSVVAQDVKKTPARAKRFRGNDPNTYPAANWDKYDDLVRAAVYFGITPYFSVTGPGPPWAMGTPPPSQKRSAATWMPKVGEWAKFVVALGKRYSGTYRDENQGRQILPRVSFWGVYNEPNQGGWLTPQYLGSPIAHKVIPWSPVMYRRLFLYGRRALQATGHGNDIILLGETAPIGNSSQNARSPMRPKKFLRELLCVNANYQPYRGTAAKARDCGIFKRLGPLTPTAYGHHPYTKTLPPTVPDSSADSITMANIGDLPNLLDKLADITHNVPKNLPVFMTEFGYETNPPDPYSGQPLAKQPEYLNEGDYLAYLNPRIFSQDQFILRDVGPVPGHKPNTKAYWFTYQSGLYFNDGNVPPPRAYDHAKPAAQAYAFPFVVNPVNGALGIWGQLRFRPNGAQGDQVFIAYRPPGGDFVGDGDPITVNNPLGFFQGTVPYMGPGTYEAIWFGADFPNFALSRAIDL